MSLKQQHHASHNMIESSPSEKQVLRRRFPLLSRTQNLDIRASLDDIVEGEEDVGGRRRKCFLPCCARPRYVVYLVAISVIASCTCFVYYVHHFGWHVEPFRKALLQLRDLTKQLSAQFDEEEDAFMVYISDQSRSFYDSLTVWTVHIVAHVALLFTAGFLIHRYQKVKAVNAGATFNSLSFLLCSLSLGIGLLGLIVSPATVLLQHFRSVSLHFADKNRSRLSDINISPSTQGDLFVWLASDFITDEFAIVVHGAPLSLMLLLPLSFFYLEAIGLLSNASATWRLAEALISVCFLLLTLFLGLNVVKAALGLEAWGLTLSYGALAVIGCLVYLIALPSGSLVLLNEHYRRSRDALGNTRRTLSFVGEEARLEQGVSLAPRTAYGSNQNYSLMCVA